jgi:hypothetical protein
MVGTALAKIATALVLLGWPERSRTGVLVTTAVAWCAVQSYTGAIFVAIGIVIALLAEPFMRRERAVLLQRAALIAAGGGRAADSVRDPPGHHAFRGQRNGARGGEHGAHPYRRDPALLAVTVLPQVAALVGYAFYVGDFLDHYYYFSLMPAAVLTLLLALTAVRRVRSATRLAWRCS